MISNKLFFYKELCTISTRAIIYYITRKGCIRCLLGIFLLFYYEGVFFYFVKCSTEKVYLGALNGYYYIFMTFWKLQISEQASGMANINFLLSNDVLRRQII